MMALEEDEEGPERKPRKYDKLTPRQRRRLKRNPTPYAQCSICRRSINLREDGLIEQNRHMHVDCYLKRPPRQRMI